MNEVEKQVKKEIPELSTNGIINDPKVGKVIDNQDQQRKELKELLSQHFPLRK